LTPSALTWRNEVAITTSHGLLAAVAPRFTRELENVATEGLAYALAQSRHVEQAFRSLITQFTGLPLSERLTWITQRGGEDNAIPDLVGEDVAGRTRVIVEAKFWAELTQNQPSTYLERLRGEDKPGVLLFIGPAVRLEGLWREVRGACREESALVAEEATHSGFRCATVMGRHRLAVTSWPAVVQALQNAASAGDDVGVVADLRQLMGLAMRMDERAFLPLHPEDLSERMPRRILHFRDLLEDASLGLANPKAGGLALKRRRGAAGPGWFGIYFEIRRPLIGLLYFSAELWSREGVSPIWFQLTTPDTWKCPKEVREKLGKLPLEEPRRIVESDWGPAVAIPLPLGVEKEVVVRAVVGEIRRIVSAVASESDLTQDGEAGRESAPEVPLAPGDLALDGGHRVE